MIDKEFVEHYMRAKFRLESALTEIGETSVSSEIELQMRFSEDRTTARVKHAIQQGINEMGGLLLILNSSEKDNQ